MKMIESKAISAMPTARSMSGDFLDAGKIGAKSIERLADQGCRVNRQLIAVTIGITALAACVGMLHAQPILVPNGSFEFQVAAPPAYADTRVDSWQKSPKPGYFDEQAYGLLWDQTAGVFLDNFVGNPSPLDNINGNQGAYVLAFPGVSLFQDYNTTDWNHPTAPHDFNATFEVGKSYQLTVGLLGGRGGMMDGTTLMLGLYYGNSLSPVTVASASAIYSATAFPSSTHLVDYTVTVPTVQAGDAWAGQNIGIELINLSGTGAGYWDLDNVRLVAAVPEPGSLSLLALGFGGLQLARARSRRQA
jgi:hypothetical protein